MTDNLYDEWASGISLANPSNDSNDFFQEIETNLDKPAEFKVTPEMLPVDPANPAAPVAVPVPDPEPASETKTTKKGGTISLEKTSRGWRATLNTGLPQLPEENFYGSNKDELIFNICEAKLEANLAIHRLKKEKLLGGDEPSPAQATPVTKPVSPKVSNLTADDIYEIKNKLTDNPSEAFDAWVKKRFGLEPEEFADALKSSKETQRIVEAQRVRADIEEVNTDFIRSNPDYAENYQNDENARLLIGRMAKSYLNKKITKSTPQSTVDDTIFELYSRGFWTADNLETAKEELIDSGLLERSESHRPAPKPQPQPVAVTGPSVPEAERIAAKNGPTQPVGFGIPARVSSPAIVSEEKPLSDVDLQNMPLDKLKAIAAAQMRALKR